ncbi:MAG: SET domain-containing histone-lysine N-methyltransferase [archaeon]|nr:SET domain-containing histone-lysine N-methyltransferase [archaeon]
MNYSAMNDFSLAVTFFNSKNYSDSLQILKNISSPKNPFEYYSLRAQNYFYLNELSFALIDAINCNEIEPNNLKVLELIFRIYLAMNDIKNSNVVLSNIEDKINKEGKEITEEEGENIQSESEESNYIPNINELKHQMEIKKEFISKQIELNPSYSDFLFFTKTLYEKNTFINKIDLNFHSNSYRSVIASEDIPKGDIILRIPLPALITLEMAMSSPNGRLITEDIRRQLNSPHHCILSTFLLEEYEKKENSEWYFYIKMLPESYSSFPIFYSDYEVETFLKGTQFYETLETKKKEIKADYDLLCKIIKDYNKYPFDLFCKYRMIIASRIFGVTVHNKKTDVLAPYADMLNHKRPRETHWTFEDKDNAFVLSAIEDIQKGEEIFDSYGKKCNSRFLLNYGFTLENNEEDNEVKVTVEMEENIPKYEEKKTIIKNSFRKFSLKKDLLDFQTMAFISYLRFLFDDGDLEKYKSNTIWKEDKFPPVSKENEINVMKKIKEIMEENLSKYKQTLSEDYKTLEKKEISYNERNCCIMRISEKEIFQYYLNMAEFMLEIFEMNQDDLYTYLSERKDHRIMVYNIYINQLRGII